jgi:hypothetical protein
MIITIYALLWACLQFSIVIRIWTIYKTAQTWVSTLILTCQACFVTRQTIIITMIITIYTLLWAGLKFLIVIRIWAIYKIAQTWVSTLILTFQACFVTRQTIIITLIKTIYTLLRACLQFLIVIRIWTIYKTAQTWVTTLILTC